MINLWKKTKGGGGGARNWPHGLLTVKEYRGYSASQLRDLMVYIKFKGVFSRNNLPRIKDGPYSINLDDKRSKETHWASLFIDKSKAVYLNSFRIDETSQEVLSKIKDKSITHNIFWIQDDDSIMCWFYCIAFIEYMLEGRTLKE